MAKKARHWCTINITQRDSREEVRRIIIHDGRKSSMHQDATHFLSAPMRTPNKWSSTVQTHGMWQNPKQFYVFFLNPCNVVAQWSHHSLVQ